MPDELGRSCCEVCVWRSRFLPPQRSDVCRSSPVTNVRRRSGVLQKIVGCIVFKKIRKWSGALAVLVVVWPLTAAHGQQRASLFDSIDENFNPVSMADMIDGKPLVLAVSSCT